MSDLSPKKIWIPEAIGVSDNFQGIQDIADYLNTRNIAPGECILIPQSETRDGIPMSRQKVIHVLIFTFPK